MRYRYAKKLANRDEVEVRVAPGQWDRGYVVGDPKLQVVLNKTMVLVNVQSVKNGFCLDVHHTNLR
jgi:hypothetical protein